jgi:hypothetical protein
MSTADETHASRLHGEALLAALRVELQPLIDQVAEQAGGRDDLRAQCAGLIAGWWFASPATQHGHELIAVGLLLLAGPVDGDLLMHWVRVGFDRRTRSARSYDPGR